MQTHLQQLRNFQSLSIPEPESYTMARNRLRKITPDFSVTNVLFLRNTHHWDISFLIKEKSEFKYGGSMFQITAIGRKSIYKCPYLDYMNGSYTVCCITSESCSTVKVQLIFIQYAGYWIYVPKPRIKVIWNHRICHEDYENENVNRDLRESKVNAISTTVPKCRSRDQHRGSLTESGLVTWAGNSKYWKNNKYIWKFKECFTEPYATNKMESCSRRINSLHIFGKAFIF